MATMTLPLLTPKRDRRPELLERIEREFRKSPRLAVTVAQAGRRWSIEATTCRDLLDLLVSDGFLDLSPDARYRRQGTP